MAKYVKSIVREGNNLIVNDDECGEVIIDLCCGEGNEGIIDKPDPNEITPPPEVNNLRCISAWMAGDILQIAFADFLTAVDPILAGVPGYAVPSIMQFIDSKGWTTSMVGPLGALLAQWTLQSRYTSIRTAVDNLPASELCEEAREIWFCTLPSNVQITSAVRGSVASQLQGLITDPCRAIGDFLSIIPIGWYIREINRSIAFYADPAEFECDLFDCGGDGGLPSEGELWDWTEREDNDGWFAINNVSTTEFAGWASGAGISEHQIMTTTPRVLSPPTPWYQPVPVSPQKTMGIQYDFPSAVTISRMSAWGTSLTSNTKIMGFYYKTAGNPTWQFMARKFWYLNSGDFSTMEYGAPGDPLPTIPNVVSVAILMVSGGGACRIYWNSINYHGAFPANIH